MILNDFDNDPVQFSSKYFQSSLTFEIINKILEIGPCQPNTSELPYGKYPIKNGHRFLPTLYQRILPDGTITKRDWLSYSKSSMRLDCINCILFPGKRPNLANKAWVLDGHQNWSTCTRLGCQHMSTLHLLEKFDNHLFIYLINRDNYIFR